MSDKQPAFNVTHSKPSTKAEFDAQAKRWHEAQAAFFADIEERRNEDKHKK